jgi:hypothetical protein
MKKISIKKLGLKTQTIRDLVPSELAKAAGAGSFFCSARCTQGSRCVCNVSETWCGYPCPI